jgi:hypothetical protein
MTDSSGRGTGQMPVNAESQFAYSNAKILPWSVWGVDW